MIVSSSVQCDICARFLGGGASGIPGPQPTFRGRHSEFLCLPLLSFICSFHSRFVFATRKKSRYHHRRYCLPYSSLCEYESMLAFSVADPDTFFKDPDPGFYIISKAITKNFWGNFCFQQKK